MCRADVEHKELIRQDKFIESMLGNGFELFEPSNYDDIIDNFRTKLEKINNIKLSDTEFKRIFNEINKGSVEMRSKNFKREFDIILDDNTHKTFHFFKTKKWCENEFQIAKEVRNENGSARFDSIIFINGLPLVLFEFKQSIIGCENGIDQIIGYKKNGKFGGLFDFVQIFIVSSFSATRYFANATEINRDFIFSWADEENNALQALLEVENALTNNLLQKCFISEMIARYMITNGKKNIILRPYQVYAVKKILDKVRDNSGNGYIFHTTGSGKTITSFKSCKLILEEFLDVDKVLFLVDRKDLDNQTKNAYEEFQVGSYTGAKNARMLKEKLLDDNRNEIIVATIQKMNIIFGENRLTDDEVKVMNGKRYVIVIDECHRSQSDTTTTNLRNYLSPSLNAQYFGFTGTPIFDENASAEDKKYKTTKSVFDKELHRYPIKNAIADHNVLPFLVSAILPKENEDEKVEFLNAKRIEKNVTHIFEKHNAYTLDKSFNSIFATASREQLMLYYFEMKKQNDNLPMNKKIKFSAIFSSNPDDDESNFDESFIKDVISDYNVLYKGNEKCNSPQEMDAFKSKIQDNIRQKTIDIVLVIDMLLTGFDSPITNTLYVDKNLRYHKLLQAYSRVNRLEVNKKRGNIVTFINQKEERDEALKLFSGGGTATDFEIDSYDNSKDKVNAGLSQLRNLVGSADTINVNDLYDSVINESGNVGLKVMRDVLKDYEFIKTHPDFLHEDIDATKMEMMEYRDVYKNLANKLKIEAETNDDVKNMLEIEQFEFDLHLFEEVSIDVIYLLRFANEKKDEVDNQVDISEEIKNFIDCNIENKDKREFLYEWSESFAKEEVTAEESYKTFKENWFVDRVKQYGLEKNVGNIEAFVQLADSQKNGEILGSDIKEYTNCLNDDAGFKEKIDFKTNAKDYIENLCEILKFN